MASQATTLICTIGTSLLKPNLYGLPETDQYMNWLSRQPQQDQDSLSLDLIAELKTRTKNQDCHQVAELLTTIPPTIRLCGAEINSIKDLIQRKYCSEKVHLVFCYSATADGKHIAHILQHYYQISGCSVTLREIEGLQDQDPKIFRTKGLRNLAKQICQTIREFSSEYCAINATGGYKAQISIAVLIGQALSVPVYYKHEQFSEVIAFPPLPIAFDINLWLEKSGWLATLNRKGDMAVAVSDPEIEADLQEDIDERFLPLIEKIELEENGKPYVLLELSPMGQIFYETFVGYFKSDRDQFLPPPIAPQQKKYPILTEHNWETAKSEIEKYLKSLVDEVPYIRTCRTHYWNKDLSQPTFFRLKANDIEGVLSNGKWTVKFIVETTAITPGQVLACIADLNHHYSDS
jgi:putative CRISPR-associated protein (TIGR02619 family)